MKLPLVKEIPGSPDPVDVFRRLSGERWTLWFDTALPGESWGRYSFLAVDPFRVLRGRGGQVGVDRSARAAPGARRPSHRAGGRAAPARIPRATRTCRRSAGAPRACSATSSRQISRRSHRPLSGTSARPTWRSVCTTWWSDGTGPRAGAGSSRPDPPKAGRPLQIAPPGAWRRPRRGCAEGPCPPNTGCPGVRPWSSPARRRPRRIPVTGARGLRSTFSPDGYREAVRRAIEWIRAGDVYQVNLSQRFEVRSDEEPGRLYLRLREASPAPFGAFFAGDDYSRSSARRPSAFCASHRRGPYRPGRSRAPGRAARIRWRMEGSPPTCRRA